MKRLGKVNKIILHHTAGNDSADVRAIRRQHMNVNGWRDIGYHFLIHRIPTKKEFITSNGRSTQFEGAHTRGANANSIGVSVAGNYQKNPLPIEARTELIKLLKKLVAEYKLNPSQISYHRKESPSLCPGKFFIEEIPKIIQEVFEVKKPKKKKVKNETTA